MGRDLGAVALGGFGDVVKALRRGGVRGAYSSRSNWTSGVA